MFRTTLLVAVVILSINAASSSPPRNKDLNTISQEISEDSTPNTSSRTKRELGSILLGIKDQFRQIVENIAFKAIKYAKDILMQFKINLLKKLQAFTLGDFVSALFDSIGETAIDFVPTTYYEMEEPVEANVVVEPKYDFSRLYSLPTLYDAKK